MRYHYAVACVAALLLLPACSASDETPETGTAATATDSSLTVEELALTGDEWRAELSGLGVPETHYNLAEAMAQPFCADQTVEQRAALLHRSRTYDDPDQAAMPEQVYGLGVRYLCPDQIQGLADAIDLVAAVQSGDDPVCSRPVEDFTGANFDEGDYTLWRYICTS